MYIIGFIKHSDPRALINPVSCRTADELYTWIKDFLNEDDFILSEPVTIDSLLNALEELRPVEIPINGHPVSLLMGADEVMQANTDRFIHITG